MTHSVDIDGELAALAQSDDQPESDQIASLEALLERINDELRQ